MTLTRILVILAALAARAAPARADDGLQSYAVVVGSNQGGEGQATLRYAEDDADRVATVLRELGGYPAEHIQIVLHPDPEALAAALTRVGVAVAADARAGRQSLVFFYYSGHARADALELGGGEVALDDLRTELAALPATLTVVVLDACQSGAFSRIKGAKPAASFSWSSKDHLAASGIAVMASSSATELSQESDALSSSYFTHHLLVALRGAGDDSGDGRVTLDEAYRYAYHQTLLSTAATAVGAQHVSLEVDLRGKGEVPLSYPARADAHLTLPKALEAEVMVSSRRPEAVIAEVHKAAGAPVELALPAGRYAVLVRTADGARECAIDLARGDDTRLAPGDCPTVALEEHATKGASPWRRGPVGLELGGGLFVPINDRFVSRLQDFGYQQDFFIFPLKFDLRAVQELMAEDTLHLSGILELDSLDDRGFSRPVDTGEMHYQWSGLGYGVGGRLAWHAPTAPVRLYAEAGLGLTVATTRLTDAVGKPTVAHDLGYYASARAGLIVERHWLGGFMEFGGTYAPTIDNLLGDTHDLGGFYGSIGLRIER